MSKQKNRFTFKKHPRETGLRAVGHPYQSVDIKRGGLVCGTIYAPTWRTNGWSVALMINKPSGENCDWSWAIGPTFNTEDGAREWLNGKSFVEPKCGLRFQPKEDDE